ncbi:uncharacterized protein Dana_GF24478 [Drosophila ananassae]|uniref:Chitin-binding type-2 domain-containing protein n=1 Tax=Drosophila ananassae TaxID=7217 RepID=B3M4Q3_DROAN|nr:peritrophin-44 isoform X1 [Drosophila ananassae]EDV39452.1 uncharacterized protein Dana_GF24478 [Drosophila ananassae]
MGAFNLRMCVLAACLLMASQAYAGYTMEQMCAQWWDTGYVGNPNDCSGWGYCSGQQLVAWGSCGANLTFNPQLGICDWSYRTPCKSNPVQTCQYATSPMYAADPTNCNQYYSCDGKGNSEVFSCGTGAVFSASVPECAWGPTCPQDSICEYMKNDIFVGDPQKCGNYILCSQGTGTSTSCESGYYNAQTGNCQPSSACDSSNSGTVTDGQFSVGDKSPTGTCSNGWSAAANLAADDATKTYRFVPDGVTCYGFYYCANDESTGIWNSCQTGTHFNPSTGQCVSPATFACTHNRCGNVPAQFMANVGTTCESYTYCAKGTTAQCPTESPYFDEVHGICTTEALPYAICAASNNDE